MMSLHLLASQAPFSAMCRWQTVLMRLDSKWDALSEKAGLHNAAVCLKRLALTQVRLTQPRSIRSGTCQQ